MNSSIEFFFSNSRNHDIIFDDNFYQEKWNFYHDEKFDHQFYIKKLRQSCVYLQDSSVIIKGLKFYGSPRTQGAWAFGFIKPNNMWYSIPDDVDVLVTHSPIQG